MRRSVERILTTHTGSLPRPRDLVAMLRDSDCTSSPLVVTIAVHLRRNGAVGLAAV